ncbi:hypothetical protein CBL_07950 [Carabus blaptoides fortunei]
MSRVKPLIRPRRLAAVAIHRNQYHHVPHKGQASKPINAIKENKNERVESQRSRPAYNTTPEKLKSVTNIFRRAGQMVPLSTEGTHHPNQEIYIMSHLQQLCRSTHTLTRHNYPDPTERLLRINRCPISIRASYMADTSDDIRAEILLSRQEPTGRRSNELTSTSYDLNEDSRSASKC